MLFQKENALKIFILRERGNLCFLISMLAKRNWFLRRGVCVLCCVHRSKIANKMLREIGS